MELYVKQGYLILVNLCPDVVPCACNPVIQRPDAENLRHRGITRDVCDFHQF